MTVTSTKKQIRSVLENEDAFATSLLAIALDNYGTDVFDWDPETLWIELAEDFGVKLPQVNKDKLQALITAYTTDLVYVSVEVFNNVCNVLSGSQANFKRWDPLTPEEALWGLYELSLNLSIDRKPGEGPPDFSHEIKQYLGVVLNQDGIFDPPDLLRIAEFDTSNDIEQWADDPEFFNATYDFQKTERARLLESLGKRLLELMNELNDLPLQFRNEKWEKFRSGISTSAQRLVNEHSSALGART